MSIFREFNINMIPGKPPLIIHVSQYESDFVYTFNLVSGKSVLAIPDTAIAVIRGTKRDGNGFSKEASLDTENNKVVVIGEVQMTACAGRNVFELAIINDEKVICTANFFLDVERAPLDSDTIQSETVLHDLQAIINSAATATQAAEEASASAESAASAAEQAVEEKFENGVAETIDEWLTDHPEATTTVQDGSITEAKLSDALKLKTIKDYVTPEMFGAKGDGVTDDSAAIQSAINYAVLFSMRLDGLNKQYIVSDAVSVPADISDTEKGLYVTGSLLMQNFKFKLKNDVSNLTSILNVHIPSGNTAIFENIEIDGNRQNQSLITTQSQNGGLHGLRIGKVGVDSGKVVVRNCRIRDCYTDGLCIRATKYDQMIVQGCIVETCGRNGFTDNAYSSLIDNCIITNNGTRVDPKSGYHIEPDSSFDFGVKRLINCIITDNVTNDFKMHFNTNAFNVQKVSIINCILGVAAWANYEASACIHNNVEFINTTLKNGFIYSIPNPNGLSKLRSIIFENCDVDENLVINGTIDHTNPITSLTLNNCRFAKSVRLSRTFALITINKCSFVRSPISDNDAIADNAIYVDYENSAETGKTITDFIVTDNYFFGGNRLFEIASAYSTIKRLVFGNNYAYNRTTILRNTGNIDVLLMNDNMFNIYGTVTRAVVQPNTCTNMIAKNNASNKSEALTFESPNVTTKIISDNIYGVT